ncbi:hypothetical protein D621_00020 [beta proteobacterium AAP51]|jgi:hypothetical protein|nr:hypothetical protein D621_00020 [beta proteobacterium AAP51]
MRTTLSLESDAFATAQAYARARSLKLGQAVSELIRLGSAERLPMRQLDGVWVFELPADTPPVTARQVKALLDDTP